MIHDGPAQRLDFFSLEGKYIRHISTAKISALLLSIKSHPDGYFIGEISHNPWSDEIEMFNPELEVQLSIAKMESEPTPSGKINIMGPSLEYEITVNREIICLCSDKYEIQYLSPEGRVIRKVAKGYNRIKITKKDQEKIKNDNLRFIRMGYELIFPEYHPPVSGLSVDDEGNIFVGTYEKTKDEKKWYDVFDAKGRYIARVAFKGGPQIWKKEKLYTIDETEEGFPTVKRHRVIWNKKVYDSNK
jgi:hypothetical protein